MIIYNKKVLITLIFLIFFLSLGFIAASDNSNELNQDLSSIDADNPNISNYGMISSESSNSNINSDNSNSIKESNIDEGDLDDSNIPSSNTVGVKDNGEIISEEFHQEEIVTTVIIAGNFTKCFGSGEKFNVYLMDNESNPISGMYLHLKINNKTYRALTDKKGMASFSFNFNPAKYSAVVYFDATSTAVSGTDSESGNIYSRITNYTASSAKCVIRIMENKTHFAVIDTNVKRYTNFRVRLLDYYNNKLIGEKVLFYINGKYSKTVKTDKNGIANLYINKKGGVYKITYYYNNTYARLRSSGTSNIHVYLIKTVLTAGNLHYIYGASRYYSAKLTNANGKPHKNFKLRFYIGSKSYAIRTNKNGVARLKLKLNPGIYKIKVKFAGDNTYSPSSISKTITVNGTYLYADSIRFYPKTYQNYSVKIKDLNKKPIVGEYVYLTYNSYTYKAKTDNKGIATFKFKTAKKSLKFYIKYKGKSSPPITVKRYMFTFKKLANNNAIWVWGGDMYGINLKTLKRSNIKNVLLHSYAIDVFGRSKVTKFIKRAKKYGVNVHIWMQCFYNGNWINPLKCGKNYLNKIISRARSYARIPGVAGIHFDYLRFGGNAYEYKGATEKINSFTKDITEAIVNINGRLILSAAIMPEKEDIYYYGQDSKVLGKYLDVLVPMVYTGNYHQSYKWIGTMTRYFKTNSAGAQVWVGLQTYKSDNNPRRLSVAKLANQVNTAYNYGADGVVLFRLGLVNFYKLRTK